MVYYDRDYIDLSLIYPKEELESESYKIKTFELSKEHVKMEKIRSSLDGNSWLTRGLEYDFPYVKLIKKDGGIMMSDTTMERNTNKYFVRSAHGDVLIFGLGLGLIILPLLKDKEVKSITVVELYQDLIDIVQPIIKKHDVDNKLTIVQGDCFEYHKEIPKDKKWDCIYGDIWINISTDNWSEMKLLTKNFKNKINRDNTNSFIDHWMKDYIQKEIKRENKEKRMYENIFGSY